MMAQNVRLLQSPVTLLFVLGIVELAKSTVLADAGTVDAARFGIKSVKLVRGDLDSLFRVRVDAREIGHEFAISWSDNERECLETNVLRRENASSNDDRDIFEFSDTSVFNVNTNFIYFCVRENPLSPWTNLGEHLSVPLEKTDSRSRRETDRNAITKYYQDVFIEGLRIEQVAKDLSIGDDGIPEILADGQAVIRLFGNVTQNTLIALTSKYGERGVVCNPKIEDLFVYDVRENTALFDLDFPTIVQTDRDLDNVVFFICTKINGSSNQNSTNLYRHQGVATFKAFRTYTRALPVWLTICIITMCLSFSALFSGLNLGLMAMDRTELKILCNTGTEKEQKYARTIQPVRNHGNYLLCSILFSNVLVNSIFTILLDGLTSGLFAVIFSTLAIVIFGEITPQAFCSRHGLCVGAKTIYITKFTMAVTCPLSYPISKLLDFFLGEEIGNVYNRERLKELVRVTNEYNDLEKDEVNIIAGALELRRKTVVDVMTPVQDIFMLDYNAIIDFETVSEIMKSGYSRIPVYENSRTNIITMLYIKDLAFIDPDDNTPLKTLCQFYQNPCNFVFEDTTLDVMFKQFKEGHKGHMAFVHRVNNEGEGDPFYEVIGLVTLEDVIEELIQAEIVDETDVFLDNRTKRKRVLCPKFPDFASFAEKRENHRIHISPQLTLAMYQYLSTTVEAFKPNVISETILRRLLKQDIIYYVKVKSRDKAKNDPATIIYQQGKAVDYFVLILEGRVQVTVGRENLLFESGPFTYFGTQALTVNIGVAESPTNANPQTMGSLQSVNLDVMLRHTFVPDFSVRAITDVHYCKIKRSLYLAAKRATLLERSQKDPTSLRSQDQFDDEVEKLLRSLDEDDRSVPESPILPKDNEDVREKDKDSENAAQTTTTVSNTPPLGNTSSPFKSSFSPYISTHNGTQRNSPIKVPAIMSDGDSVSFRQLTNKGTLEKEEERDALLTGTSDS